ASCPRGALGDILDRWIGAVEEALINAGGDDGADDFDEKVRKRLNEDLVSLTGGKAPEDFIRVVQTVFDLKQDGEVADAGALISWLCGSGNVAASAKKAAQIKGDIGSRDALHYLRGVLEIVKAAGYKGLVIVIDEAETILRMRKDSRHKSLNGIRQIADAASSYPGLLWLFTGTAEFFDTRQGVAGLAPLHDRIHFISSGGFASMRQAQLELKPFDAERLNAVALRLREMHPAQDRSRLESAISEQFIRRLVDEATTGFKGDVGVVPRQFLREFVTQMDLVDENEGYNPSEQYGFKPADLSPEEQNAMSGVGNSSDSDGNDLVPMEDAW
ncbi:MAG: BREX system ATP-binding protein BrxD, partial [Pirellulaceae bacterium]